MANAGPWPKSGSTVRDLFDAVARTPSATSNVFAIRDEFPCLVYGNRPRIILVRYYADDGLSVRSKNSERNARYVRWAAIKSENFPKFHISSTGRFSRLNLCPLRIIALRCLRSSLLSAFTRGLIALFVSSRRARCDSINRPKLSSIGPRKLRMSSGVSKSMGFVLSSSTFKNGTPLSSTSSRHRKCVGFMG